MNNQTHLHPAHGTYILAQVSFATWHLARSTSTTDQSQPITRRKYSHTCWYKVSFSSQMLPSANYTFIPKSGTRLNFIILALLFLLFLYAFFGYLRSLLRISLLRYLGGRSKTEPLYYITGLYLSYDSCCSSSQQSMILTVIYYHFSVKSIAYCNNTR